MILYATSYIMYKSTQPTNEWNDRNGDGFNEGDQSEDHQAKQIIRYTRITFVVVVYLKVNGKDELSCDGCEGSRAVAFGLCMMQKQMRLLFIQTNTVQRFWTVQTTSVVARINKRWSSTLNRRDQLDCHANWPNLPERYAQALPGKFRVSSVYDTRVWRRGMHPLAITVRPSSISQPS